MFKNSAVKVKPATVRKRSESLVFIRDCLKKRRWPAAGDFGCGRGGEFRASPQRAVRDEATKPTAKSTAARRVFASKPVAPSPRRARPSWTQKQAASAFSDSLLERFKKYCSHS